MQHTTNKRRAYSTKSRPATTNRKRYTTRSYRGSSPSWRQHGLEMNVGEAIVLALAMGSAGRIVGRVR